MNEMKELGYVNIWKKSIPEGLASAKTLRPVHNRPVRGIARRPAWLALSKQEDVNDDRWMNE